MFAEALYQIKRPFHLVKTGLWKGWRAELNYKHPAKNLKIICITGTDGKTTSSTLLYRVLQQAGKKVALLSTVAAYIGKAEIDTGFHVTTPDPAALQQFLRKMVDEGYEYLVLEATSHGIYQHRLWGIKPMLAGVTNITYEHLDYHVSYDNYLEAKAELLAKAKTAVINEDDELSFFKLRRRLKQAGTNVLTYSKNAELPLRVAQAITARFSQDYNRMNARLVYALAKQLDVEDSDFTKAVRGFVGVPGRMELVGEAKGIKVMVDFAHTPNALSNALATLRQQMQTERRVGRLIAVFGCAGLRYVGKRPMMGKIAGEQADLAVFTAEDPRTENIWSILRQMKSDLGTNHHKVLSIADRKDAVQFAITKLAKSGDVVCMFGKGHEKSMCYGTIEYPWSDAEAGKAALAELRKL